MDKIVDCLTLTLNDTNINKISMRKSFFNVTVAFF